MPIRDFDITPKGNSMALKKSAIYSSLWKSCDELRGGMDASQYKDYVLVLLFVKHVSDKYTGDPNALIVVPVGGGFSDMVAAKGHKEIGDKINTIIGRLADANDTLKGAIHVANFNDDEKLNWRNATPRRCRSWPMK
ncbi:MAG: type I restriction-modification system subunit M N-terminal domain-containing protein [Magnetococcus sp. DMHC-1]